MTHWWFWMGWPRGQYRSFGPVEEDYRGAFEAQTGLERNHPAFWHRWRWDGARWIYEGHEKVSLLGRSATPGLMAQW